MVCLLCVTVCFAQACSCGKILTERLHVKHWEGVMTDLWLISVPLDKTSITSVEKLKRTIAKTNLASCFMFSIPDLKVSFPVCPREEPEGAKKITQSKCRHKDQLWKSIFLNC